MVKIWYKTEENVLSQNQPKFCLKNQNLKDNIDNVWPGFLHFNLIEL